MNSADDQIVRNKPNGDDGDIGMIETLETRSCNNQIIESGMTDEMKIIRKNEQMARNRLE